MADEEGSGSTRDVMVSHLFRDAYGGKSLRVMKWLDHGINPNEQNKKGQTAIFFAASNGHFKTTAILCARGAKLDVQDINGNTPLHYAVSRKQANIVGLLREYGADASVENVRGEIPLDIVTSERVRDKLTADSLIPFEERASDKNPADAKGNTRLHKYTALGKVGKVKRMLDKSIDPNCFNENGETPLHFAVRRGDVKLVIVLVEQNAYINSQNNRGETPLHLACKYQRDAIVKHLVEYQADISILTNVGEDARKLATSKKSQKFLEEAVLRCEPKTHKVIGDYVLGQTLGSGSFAKVKVATHMHTKAKYAMKIVERSSLDEEDVVRLYREIFLMKVLKHTTIVEFCDHFESDRNIYLAMELVDGVDLFDWIFDNDPVNEKDAQVIFRQLVEGIHFIHQFGIVHRDLKPENLLLKDDLSLKIIDFGLSNVHQKLIFQTACGSPHYVAPEVLLGTAYGPEVDVWSMGVILNVMLFGELPFDEDLDVTTVPMLEKYISFPNDIQRSRSCKDLIRKLLVRNPHERISLEELRAHPWVNLPKVSPPGFPEVSEVSPIVVEQMERYLGFDYNFIMSSIENHIHNSASHIYALLSKYGRKKRKPDRVETVVVGGRNPVNHMKMMEGLHNRQAQRPGVTPKDSNDLKLTDITKIRRVDSSGRLESSDNAKYFHMPEVSKDEGAAKPVGNDGVEQRRKEKEQAKKVAATAAVNDDNLFSAASEDAETDKEESAPGAEDAVKTVKGVGDDTTILAPTPEVAGEESKRPTPLNVQEDEMANSKPAKEVEKTGSDSSMEGKAVWRPAVSEGLPTPPPKPRTMKYSDQNSAKKSNTEKGSSLAKEQPKSGDKAPASTNKTRKSSKEDDGGSSSKEPAKSGNQKPSSTKVEAKSTKEADGGSSSKEPAKSGNQKPSSTKVEAKSTKEADGGSSSKEPAKSGNQKPSSTKVEAKSTKEADGGSSSKEPAKSGNQKPSSTKVEAKSTKEADGGSSSKEPAKSGNQKPSSTKVEAKSTKEADGGSSSKMQAKSGNQKPSSSKVEAKSTKEADGGSSSKMQAKSGDKTSTSTKATRKSSSETEGDSITKERLKPGKQPSASPKAEQTTRKRSSREDDIRRKSKSTLDVIHVKNGKEDPRGKKKGIRSGSFTEKGKKSQSGSSTPKSGSTLAKKESKNKSSSLGSTSTQSATSEQNEEKKRTKEPREQAKEVSTPETTQKRPRTPKGSPKVSTRKKRVQSEETNSPARTPNDEPKAGDVVGNCTNEPSTAKPKVDPNRRNRKTARWLAVVQEKMEEKKDLEQRERERRMGELERQLESYSEKNK